MEALFTPFLPAMTLLAAMFLPVSLVVAIVALQKRAERRDRRRSPLNDKLLHQAGAQARMKADEIGDDIQGRIVQLIVIGPLAMLAILLPRVQWSRLQFGWLEWVIGLGSITAILAITHQVVRLRRARRNWMDGMRAEIAAAQALDRLRANGCEVFHDVPTGKDFNLDHVVVGPSAVLVVETKSRRKPAKGMGSADVRFDGKRLTFAGGHWDEAAVSQAEAEAAWLSKYLQGETGQRVPVVPVVSLPGWFVRPLPVEQTSPAKAINPKRAYMLLQDRRPALHAAQRNRIVNALVKLYPEQED
ncbi:nuclease-related domain-containing protein [Luteimonas sp. SDU101]|uniref:nuclease-related domain-containing protein n=1 Tax=Luteimonas sp. SDU101 TaxID=3422593 RepID=UPI003EBBD246